MSADQDVWTPRLNGTGQADVRVPFADGTTDDLPLDKAEAVLRYVYEHARGTFASAMLAIYAPGYKATKDSQAKP